MNQQMIALYDLAQEIGKPDFVAALELAAEQQMYGVEYVRAILTMPSALAPITSVEADTDLARLAVPAQQEVERDLAQYEQYVANRQSVLVAGRQA